MEIVQRHEISFQQPREEAQIHAVSKLTVQVIHFQVDLVYNIYMMISYNFDRYIFIIIQ